MEHGTSFASHIHARIVFLLVVFFLFAFAEELPTTAFGVILTTDLNVSPAVQTFYYSAVFTAFSFQPLFGVIAQFISIYACCKLKYFAISGVAIGGFMYIIIGCTKPTFTYLLLFTILLNIGLAFCNAIIDGISVEISNYFKHQNNTRNTVYQDDLNAVLTSEYENNDPPMHCCTKYFNFGSAASIQSLSYFFRSCGSLMSSSMLIALRDFDNYSAITWTGIIYLCIVLPFLLLLFPKHSERKQPKRKKTIGNECNKYLRIVSRIWRCLLFVFLLNMAPTMTDVFYAFIYSRLYFTNTELRVFKFMSLVGAALGGAIYFLFLSRFGTNKRHLKIIFIAMQTLNGLCGLIFLPLSNLANAFETNDSLHSVYGIPFVYYISMMLFLYTFISSLVLMPQLTLAAQMTPLHLETSVFSCFVGASHLGQLVSAFISSTLLTALNIKQLHWQNLTKYIIICNVSQFIPLSGLLLLNEVNNDDEHEHSMAIENQMAQSESDEADQQNRYSTRGVVN